MFWNNLVNKCQTFRLSDKKTLVWWCTIVDNSSQTFEQIRKKHTFFDLLILPRFFSSNFFVRRRSSVTHHHSEKCLWRVWAGKTHTLSPAQSPEDNWKTSNRKIITFSHKRQPNLSLFLTLSFFLVYSEVKSDGRNLLSKLTSVTKNVQTNIFSPNYSFHFFLECAKGWNFSIFNAKMEF